MLYVICVGKLYLYRINTNVNQLRLVCDVRFRAMNGFTISGLCRTQELNVCVSDMGANRVKTNAQATC